MRIERKSWQHNEYDDLFDTLVRKNLRLKSDEIDILFGNMNDEEMDSVLNPRPSFTQKRQIITILNKYLPPSKSNK